MGIDRKGYSLLETLLVFALLGGVLALTFPVALTAYRRTELWETRDLAVQAVRRAQALALGAVGDEPWGVKFVPGEVIVFKGAGFDGRDPDADEHFPVPASVVWSGTSEVIFAQVTGAASSPGPLETTITLGEAGTVTVRVNEQGLPSYE